MAENVKCYPWGDPDAREGDYIYASIIVFEYAEMDLLAYINRCQKISEKEAAKVLRECSAGLYYMHNQNVSHRDLKPENIFRVNGVWKIGDFGYASESGSNWTSAVSNISQVYKPPVDHSFEKCQDKKSDVWSLGIVILLMLYINQFFGDPLEFIRKEREKGYEAFEDFDFESVYAGVSDDAIDVVMWMLNPNPDERCSAGDLTMLDWVRGCDLNGNAYRYEEDIYVDEVIDLTSSSSSI